VTEVAVGPKKAACFLVGKSGYDIGDNRSYCAEARSFCVRAFEVNEPTDRRTIPIDLRGRQGKF
jgi:hypothetical protein